MTSETLVAIRAHYGEMNHDALEVNKLLIVAIDLWPVML
jgi:hypothetical protein